MDGIEEPKTAKDLFKERLQAKYPEKDFSNEDELYTTSMEGYDKEHEAMKDVKAKNSALMERMMADPKAAAALAEFLDGKPLPVALKKYFNEDELAMQEGEQGYEEYLEAIKERTEREAGNQQAQQEYEANLEASRANVEAFAQEKGMSPEEFDTFMEQATDKTIAPLLKGNITPELLEILYKGMNYEADVAQAQEVGRIAGKNEKITETRRTKKADGLPGANGGGGSAAVTEGAPANPTAEFFGKVAANAQSKDIWDRGGYKKA